MTHAGRCFLCFSGKASTHLAYHSMTVKTVYMVTHKINKLCGIFKSGLSSLFWVTARVLRSSFERETNQRCLIPLVKAIRVRVRSLDSLGCTRPGSLFCCNRATPTSHFALGAAATTVSMGEADSRRETQFRRKRQNCNATELLLLLPRLCFSTQSVSVWTGLNSPLAFRQMMNRLRQVSVQIFLLPSAVKIKFKKCNNQIIENYNRQGEVTAYGLFPKTPVNENSEYPHDTTSREGPNRR